MLVEQAGYGGGRLADLERQLVAEAAERDRRRHRHDRFTELLGDARLTEPADEAQFEALRRQVDTAAVEADATQAECQNRLTEVAVEQTTLMAESKELNAELASLQGNRSNLPRRLLEMRERMAAALSLPVEELPFAGELIQVRPEAAPWEGAAERVLHGFGVSMLVPSVHYPAVSDWIDANHLGLRLVYYRVPATVAAMAAPELPGWPVTCPLIRCTASCRSGTTHPSTPGWNASCGAGPTTTAPPPRRSSDVVRRPSPGQARSVPAIGTRRTTTGRSTIGAATCWVGTRRPRSMPCSPRGSDSNGSWPGPPPGWHRSRQSWTTRPLGAA